MYSAVQKIFPVIDCGDFILREKQDKDAANYFEIYSDERVNKFILCQMPTSEAEALDDLKYWRGTFYRNDGAYFAIADKATDAAIGAIGLTGHNSYSSRIEISYDLAHDYWGKGVMTKAINTIVKYAFDVVRVNRIEASVAVDNIPSKNLLLKCGFQLEGILREHRYHKGVYVDVFFFSLLRKEFLNKNYDEIIYLNQA